VYRLPSIAIILVSIAVGAAEAPVLTGTMACAEERFVAGERILPSHGEAMLQCRQEERTLTELASGGFEKERSCYDVDSPAPHGDWHYGRIAMDVVERHSGDAYTFETLWMCKPL
jgi:hypothetical protein